MSHVFIQTAIAMGMGVFLSGASACAWAAEPVVTTQTIVLIRHGEKPDAGLGQLSCQGLNRALALPSVIRKNFGKPDFIFAPNPGETKNDGGLPYNYIRPLATIEPTAIAFGMPVNTQFGVSGIDGLLKALDEPAYRNAFTLIAWEHVELVKLTRLLASASTTPPTIPEWSGKDFDGVFVLRITRGGTAPKVDFKRSLEGLDDQPKSCRG